MVSRAINPMKNCKATGPIKIVVEMIPAAGPFAVTDIKKTSDLLLLKKVTSQKDGTYPT